VSKAKLPSARDSAGANSGDRQHARIMCEESRDRVCEHRVAEYHASGELRGQQMESAPVSHTKNATDEPMVVTSDLCEVDL